MLYPHNILSIKDEKSWASEESIDNWVTCHRPASRPYFLVTSSAEEEEEEEEGSLFSLVFSLIALTLKRFGMEPGTRGENDKGALNRCPLMFREEGDERPSSSFVDAIVSRSKGFAATIPSSSPSG